MEENGEAGADNSKIPADDESVALDMEEPMDDQQSADINEQGSPSLDGSRSPTTPVPDTAHKERHNS